nr:zf-HC2 domain-containing protein [uncultured Actinoplanes sp.]
MNTDINQTGDHVDLAGYLMDTLTPDEKHEVEEHLAGCAACRAEVETLREWTVALEAVPEAMMLDGPPEGGDLLLQRTLRQIRSEATGRRHRRTAMVSSAAVVAAVAVIAGGVFAGRATAPDVPQAQPPVQTQPTARPGTRTATAVDAATGARITVAVSPAPGWVRINAAVSGIPAGEKCRLEVVGKDGQTVVAGSWIVSRTGEAGGTNLDGSALMDPADVRSVRVVNTAGKQFTSVNL